jgi:hypothetical protein
MANLAEYYKQYRLEQASIPKADVLLSRLRAHLDGIEADLGLLAHDALVGQREPVYELMNVSDDLARLNALALGVEWFLTPEPGPVPPEPGEPAPWP